MPASPMHAVTLTCHPATPAEAIRSIGVRVFRTAGMLAATYVLEGDLERLRVPEPGPRCVADKLWQHTCCEMFIARNGAPGYHEFNFAPSGEWAAYVFEHYRVRATLDDAYKLDPHIAIRRTATTLEIDALIYLDRLSTLHAASRLSLALSVVVEHQTGSLSYWALKHSPGKPDFHHPESFALELE